MADVDLDDLYNQGDTAEGGPAPEEQAGMEGAEAAEPTGRTPVTHEELLQQLRCDRSLGWMLSACCR